MTGVTPDTASAITTGGCAVVLAVTALRAGVVRLRPEPRRCPSCGRRLRARTCWGCTHRRGD